MTEFNIKRSKIKTITTLFMIGLIMMLLPITVIPNVSAQSLNPIDSNCVNKSEELVNAKSSSLNETKAKLMAVNYKEFKTRTQSYVVTNGGDTFTEWVIERTNCTPVLKNINVVFFLNDEKGYAKNLVFTLDPTLTTITNVTEYRSTYHYHVIAPSSNWSGYEFAGNSAGNMTIYKAQVVFNQPTVSQPTGSGQPTCAAAPFCSLSIWTGLEDEYGASPDKHLVQTGSQGKIDCSTCSPDYSMWWEDLPDASVSCGSINAGDQISARVTNEGINSTNTSTYDFYTVDTNSSLLCYHKLLNYTNMTVPTKASFINERDCYSDCLSDNPVYYHLPKYVNDNMTGYLYYNNTLNSISVPYDEDRYWHWQMQNP